MKRNSLLFIAVMMILATLFSACGKKNKPMVEEPSPTPTESSQPTDEPSPSPDKADESMKPVGGVTTSPTPSATPASEQKPSQTPTQKPSESPKPATAQPNAANGTDPKVLDFVEYTRQQMEASKAQMGAGIDIQISARGNSVVHAYTFLDVIDTEAAKPQIIQSVEATKTIYQEDLDILKYNDIKSPSIIVEYYDKNKALIYSREFK